MSGRSGDDGPIELHLPDGGHVIVSFADPLARADGDGMVETLLSGDTERDVERAIVGDLEGSELSCSVSRDHPTVIVIGRR
jgi:hypothetical protein